MPKYAKVSIVFRAAPLCYMSYLICHASCFVFDPLLSEPHSVLKLRTMSTIRDFPYRTANNLTTAAFAALNPKLNCKAATAPIPPGELSATYLKFEPARTCATIKTICTCYLGLVQELRVFLGVAGTAVCTAGPLAYCNHVVTATCAYAMATYSLSNAQLAALNPQLDMSKCGSAAQLCVAAPIQVHLIRSTSHEISILQQSTIVYA